MPGRSAPSRPDASQPRQSSAKAAQKQRSSARGRAVPPVLFPKSSPSVFLFLFLFSGRFSFPRCHRAAFGFRALRVGAERWDRGAFSPFPPDYFLLPKSPQPRTAPHPSSFLPPFAPSGSAFFSFFLSFFLFISLFIASRLFFNRKFRPFPRRSRFLSLSLFAGNRRYLSSFSR